MKTSKHLCDYTSDLSGEQRRNGIANLDILLGSATAKQIIVRKCLQACGLTYCETSTLCSVVMDVIVSIFGNVTRYGCGRLIWNLYAKSVIKVFLLSIFTYVLMIRKQARRKIAQFR